MDTLRATAADGFDDDHKLITRRGQCITSVVELTDPPPVHSVVTYGQSNDPKSKHFADQGELYAEEQLRNVPWTFETAETTDRIAGHFPLSWKAL